MIAAARGLVDGVVLAHGWRRAAIAMAAGAIGSLALPPFGLLPALALGFAPLVWLMDGAAAAGHLRARLRAAFVIGWSFGFGWLGASLWWIGEAFLVEADQFAWALPLGVLGLPAGLALFTGLGAALAQALWTPGPWRIAALALGLGASEWLRGVAFTGFPWNAFGYALTANDLAMQAASLVGLHGLTPLAVLIAAAPATLADPRRRERARLAPVALAGALLLGQYAYGAVRLASAQDGAVPEVRLRLVQPNLTQAERRDPARHLAVFERYLRLSSTGTGPAPTHVIWPESALPFSIDGAGGVLSRIARTLPEGAVLIMGLLRPEEGGTGRVFNSLIVIDHEARVAARYDKTHLVPFGEYLPWPELMARIGLEPLTRVLAFVPGALRAPVATPGAPPFSPLICYEVIFPGAVAGDGARPGWLLNISDDSWFGDTLGPRQHLHQARVRAAEEGLPLIRVTTTGVSAAIDPYGRITMSIQSGVEYSQDVVLPVAIELTVYANFRDLIAAGLLSAMLLLTMLAHWDFKRQSRDT